MRYNDRNQILQPKEEALYASTRINTNTIAGSICKQASKRYVCITDASGTILFHGNLKAAPEPFTSVTEPYRGNLAVAVVCMFSWYWLADLCGQLGITFVLGHALYMKAIHGGKVKNDKIDSSGSPFIAF